MFKNIKIEKKLLGIIILVIIMAECIGVYALIEFSNLGDKIKQISNIELPAVNYLRSIDKEVNYLVACERSLALDTMFDNETIRKGLFESIDDSWGRLEKNWAEYKKLPKEEDEKTMWDEFAVNFQLWKTKHATGMEALKNKQKLLEEGVTEGDSRYQKLNKAVAQAELDGRASLYATTNGLDKIVSFIAVRSQTSAEKTSLSATKTKGIYIIMMIIGGIIAISSIMPMVLSITKPLIKGSTMIKEMSMGHLSGRFNMGDRKDEIGVLFNYMDKFVDNLQKNIVFNLQEISEGNMNVEPAVIDEEDEIGPALKKMVETVKNLVSEMNVLTTSAMQGKLELRGNQEAFSGAYHDIIHGVNKTLDAVMGPINEASKVLEKMADRDMTVRMIGDYKGDHARIKESINQVVENLDKSLQQVAIGADQVASASMQVSSGGQSLSQGASEQASSLEEISSSLQEMSSMTKQNAINAREAKGVAEEARVSAEKGVESMNRMSLAINKIKSSSDSTSKIVKTIDEIAFQTNLLALNAAVEAARAGDAGRGFAVVAEEVRNLAMRSAEAAKNTANLIEEEVKNSENGVIINSEVLKNFQEITERINKVSQVVAEIATASDQQEQGISQVSKAVEQMNQLTQQNAANAEESASAAEEMSSQSEQMRSMVAGFKLTSTSDGFRKVLPDGGQSRHMPPNLFAGEKGVKTMSELQPDPRKVIPLDDKDHDILKHF